MYRYSEIGYGLSNDTKMSPQHSPLPPHLWCRKREKAKIGLLLSNDKLCYKVVPNNNLQRQSCSSKCLEGIRLNNFEINEYLRLLQRFPYTPDRYVRSVAFTKRLH